MTDYEYLVNVEGAVYRDGEYLLIERSAEEEHAAGLLGFPGGKVEAAPGSTDVIEATARREVAEETGVEVGGVDYVASTAFETDGGRQCVNVVTLCEYAGGDARVRDPAEVAAVRWLSYDAIRGDESVPAFTGEAAERVESHRRYR